MGDVAAMLAKLEPQPPIEIERVRVSRAGSGPVTERWTWTREIEVQDKRQFSRLTVYRMGRDRRFQPQTGEQQRQASHRSAGDLHQDAVLALRLESAVSSHPINGKT